MPIFQQSPLDPSWQRVLGAEFDKPYMQNLAAFLAAERAAGKVIFPPEPLVFNAFNHTPFEQVRVVIIGQDPYHGEGQAHGLSFSVPEGIKPPPSLVNIFKEMESDLGVAMSGLGDLTPWANQGVLLLNAMLTVEQANAGSHQKKGWEAFTDAAIAALNAEREGLVFLLWGGYAQKKCKAIDQTKHLVLQSAHPSPLSVYRGFYGSKPFSQINQYLTARGQTPIQWQF
ncbi:MAG: uracil-DNA glycosylase [Thalassolituus oleivorans]|uniref:uracil-DNA glycosylase n=1 Tax=Thalassolituus oleivorans TaxID=187493 RepID=UPI001B513C1C|nr:uracil-DNA glycosylase [Thalassolituus oleivorans]MBQ0726638.1 uracil-DNA glycosylase [Thalassolituus oleivorans]MBQ0781015.1 uracil-DNA glycosylase [Thalassolituus oleivorans]